MGEKNVVTKKYMQDNARFADACNYYLFHGEQVIKPESLKERDVTELALPQKLGSRVAIEKIRDILKKCCVKTADGVTYFIVGIENQTDVHYAMVVRNMLYDALNYASQAETYAKKHRKKKDVSGAEFLSGFAKDDRLHPVVTLTIYWKYGTWAGARSLHEMLDVQEPSILNYVSDYKLNLIVPEEIKDFEKFKTELGPLLEFISDASSGKKLRKALEEKRDRWSVFGDEEVDLLNICLDAKIKLTEKESKEQEKKGEKDKVCRGIIELQEMSREEGMRQGRRQGRRQGIRQGRLEELENLISKKIRKMKPLEQIAEELESEVEEIRPIYERVKSAMV